MSEIRRLRQSAGLTQKQVAERLGVNEQTVARLEKGQHLPLLSLSQWLELAELYRVTATALSVALATTEKEFSKTA
ncbi:MAG: hypothetical protein NVS2B14_00150 [Chamaesiphon sp.]